MTLPEGDNKITIVGKWKSKSGAIGTAEESLETLEFYEDGIVSFPGTNVRPWTYTVLPGALTSSKGTIIFKDEKNIDVARHEYVLLGDSLTLGGHAVYERVSQPTTVTSSISIVGKWKPKSDATGAIGNAEGPFEILEFHEDGTVSFPGTDVKPWTYTVSPDYPYLGTIHFIYDENTEGDLGYHLSGDTLTFVGGIEYERVK